MIDPKKIKPLRSYSVNGGGVGRYGNVNKQLSALNKSNKEILKHIYKS